MFEIGTSLREARIRQQLGFPEIEAGTKIRAKYLRALEEERFDMLPAHTYIKGFLRTYADFLGLDGQLYVDEYNSRFVAGLDEDAPVRARRSPAPRRRQPHRLEANVVVLALTAIALVTGLVIVAWKFGGEGKPRVRGLETGTAAPAVAPPAAKQPPTLVVVAKGSTKLEVRAGGPAARLLYSGTVEKGQRPLRFDGERLYLRVGRPAALEVVVDGVARGRLAPRWGEYLVTRKSLQRYRGS